MGWGNGVAATGSRIRRSSPGRKAEQEKVRVEVRDGLMFRSPGASWEILFQEIQNYLSISIQAYLLFQL